MAVKKLRIGAESDQMRSLKFETSLAISLLHPNITRVYGTTRSSTDGRVGIVMEWAQGGSLEAVADSLVTGQKVSVSIDICSGLAYLHSKRVAHRDLKPDNVLLFGSKPTAKISDFGTSKVLQTFIKNTSMVGTPNYAAPELLQAGVVYGSSVDTYSLAMILYKLFTGSDPFQGMDMLQTIAALIQKSRPAFPRDFPHKALTEVIRKGWSDRPEDRAGIEEFRKVLRSMKQAESPAERSVSSEANRISNVRARDQIAEVRRTTMPVPLIGMKWTGPQCETGNSVELRKRMVEKLKIESNMKSMITASVLKAMEAVPRHVFMEASRTPGDSEDEKAESVYAHNRAMGATKDSNESSPEIIGAQLSLVKIDPGSNVLLVGGKGGYIGSLVAQIAGVNGSVITVSSKEEILQTCKSRVDRHSPISSVMRWVRLADVGSHECVLEAFEDSHKGHFHAIIYCGSVASLPEELCPILADNGSLIAPVELSGGQQQLQMVILGERRRKEVRKITEFGVIFEKAK